MHIDNMPGCCTSAILYSFGEHGEPSTVTVETVKEFVKSKTTSVYGWDKGKRVLMDPGKKCIFAISVNPDNIAVLKEAGFTVVDSYDGIQGKVHVLTLHT